MKSALYRALLCAILFVGGCLGGVAAQDLEETYNTTKERIKKDPVQVSGGLTLGGQFASTTGGRQRYDDFDWGLQARLNFNVLGWDVPFSAFISDRNRLYNLPSYQFVGLSPSYRWIRLHLGDRSMNFNPYTFSNQQFRGAGFELTPGKWFVSGFYGRLNRLRLSDYSARQSIAGSYRRMGYAASVGYAGEQYSVKLTAFRAEDQVPDTLTMGLVSRTAPAKNLVTSVEAGASLIKNLRLQGTLASSWLTDDAEAIGVPDSIYRARFGGNATSTQETAIRSNLVYSRPKSNWTLGYERLSPNYRSLGTLYLTPDRENITLGTTTSLAKGKVSLSLNGGLQRSNLKDDRRVAQRRIISQISLSAQPNKRLMLSLNLGNFNYTSRVRSFLDPTSNTDSVFIAQVNRSARVGAIYRRSENAASPGALTFNFSIQDAQSIKDEQLTTFTSTLYNTYLGYAGRWSATTLDYQVQFLYAITQADPADNRTYGPSLSLRRSFKEDKIGLALTGSYSWVDSDLEGSDGKIFLSRLSATYQISKKNALQGNLQYSRRRSGERDPFNETIAALQYNWNF